MSECVGEAEEANECGEEKRGRRSERHRGNLNRRRKGGEKKGKRRVIKI